MKDSSAQSAEFESLTLRTDAHRRGYDFQPFVGNLFRAQHFKVDEKAGISAPRQVDLLATRGEEVYLIETKWQQDPADIDDVDALFTRLEPVPPGVVGLLVSFSGFSQSVIDKVKEKSSRPVLLVSGVEIEQALGWSGDFISLLRRKKSALLTHRRVLIDEMPEPRSNGKKIKASDLPASSTSFLLPSGERTSSFQTGGGFGKFTFVRELPDIDWVGGGGFGVSLDLAVPVQSQDDLLVMIHDMADMGWVTSDGVWSIQQATANWHGFGAKTLAQSLKGWRKRYKGLETHHAEELCYVNEVENGYYTLTAAISADHRRIVWRTELSFQLTGIPLVQEPLKQLCDELGIHDGLHFRPRNEQSVARTRTPRDVSLPLVTPVAFVIDKPERGPARHEEWVVGIVVANPYKRSEGSVRRDMPEWVPDMLLDSEHLVCALRSWHQVDRPKSHYELWEFESSWTSDALAVRAVADWRDDAGDFEELSPSLVLEMSQDDEDGVTLVDTAIGGSNVVRKCPGT